MKRHRVSLATMMGTVAAAAVTFSVMHAFDPGSPHSLPHFLYATGVMPVASLLILVGVCSVPRVLQSGELSSFVIGFEAFGWTAVFAFITCYSVATTTFMAGAEAIAAMGRPVVIAYLQDTPDWLGVFVELGFATVLFSLPQLLLALLGGFLARRAGVTARFALANRCGHAARAASDSSPDAEAEEPRGG
jgi:hypothetical protein